MVQQEINMKQIIYFTSPTCGPCKMLAPIMEELKADLNIKKIDVSDPLGADLAEDYGIRGVPTAIFLKNGQEIDRAIGAKSKQFYMDKWESL